MAVEIAAEMNREPAGAEKSDSTLEGTIGTCDWVSQ